MNKTELVEFIATQADISKAKAGEAVDAFVEAVTASLKKGKDVAIVGLPSLNALLVRAAIPRPAKRSKSPRPRHRSSVLANL